MYARVVTNQIQAGKMDEWLALIRESIVPSLEEQDGFLGFVVLAAPPMREAYELTVVA
jgi:quinol monooxygenase YgiN